MVKGPGKTVGYVRCSVEEGSGSASRRKRIEYGLFAMLPVAS